MIGRVIEIATPGTRVRKARGSLSIEAPGGHPPETIPLDALEAVILHDAATLSVATINALLDAGVNVVFCDGKQRPASIVFPLEGHHVQSRRMQLQLAASQPLQKRLWQSIVQSKIERQSEVLERVVHSRALLPFAGRVRSGDPDNVEAQAARLYWRELFGQAFRRGRFPDPANALLNYGYAIIRSAMARAVAATGFHPSFALHHRDARNAMALVDDLMEPYRPLVDVIAYDFLVTLQKGFDGDAKAALAAVPVTDLKTDVGNSPVRNCMVRTVSSLFESFERAAPLIWYPEAGIS